MIGSSHTVKLPYKIKDLYCIRKTNRHRVERAQVLRIVNLLCRLTVVIGFVAVVGIWGGAEFGALLIGKRLLWTAADVLLIKAAIYGDQITAED